MSTFYLRKPITIAKRNTYVYCQHKWRDRTFPPPFEDKYVKKFVYLWGDGKYQFLIYQRGKSTRIFKKIKVVGLGWRGMVKGYSGNKKRYKKYKNGEVKPADHCDHCFELGANYALEGVNELDEEIYMQGYKDGAEDALYYEGRGLRIRGKTSFMHEENGDDEEYDEVRFCPDCDGQLEYDEKEDLYYCPDEECGWEEG